MAAWPTVAEVKAALGVTNDAQNAMIAAALGAAIEQVGTDIGYEDVTVATPEAVAVLSGTLDDEVVTVTPTYKMTMAALIMAVMTVKAPDAPYGVAAVFDMGGMRVSADHPTYLKMLSGNRVSFAVG